MTTPPVSDPHVLAGRHVRSIAGLVGMVVAIILFALIQYMRVEQEQLLAAHGVAPTVIVPPTTWLELVYTLAIPVGMPLFIFILSVMLFSPTVFGQAVASIRSLLPWTKNAT